MNIDTNTSGGYDLRASTGSVCSLLCNGTNSGLPSSWLVVCCCCWLLFKSDLIPLVFLTPNSFWPSLRLCSRCWCIIVASVDCSPSTSEPLVDAELWESIVELSRISTSLSLRSLLPSWLPSLCNEELPFILILEVPASSHWWLEHDWLLDSGCFNKSLIGPHVSQRHVREFLANFLRSGSE